MDLNILKPIGNGVSWLTQKAILFISELGIKTTQVHAKIITILIFLVGCWIIISVLTIPKKLIKWGIFAIFVLLIISIIVSMF